LANCTRTYTQALLTLKRYQSWYELDIINANFNFVIFIFFMLDFLSS
jgi:hypothetical protein